MHPCTALPKERMNFETNEAALLKLLDNDQINQLISVEYELFAATAGTGDR